MLDSQGLSLQEHGCRRVWNVHVGLRSPQLGRLWTNIFDGRNVGERATFEACFRRLLRLRSLYEHIASIATVNGYHEDISIKPHSRRSLAVTIDGSETSCYESKISPYITAACLAWKQNGWGIEPHIRIANNDCRRARQIMAVQNGQRLSSKERVYISVQGSVHVSSLTVSSCRS